MNSVEPDEITNSDWLAGFTDGEGSFNIEQRCGTHVFSFTFHITLRDDDEAILEACQLAFGGSLNGDVKRSQPGNPQMRWRIQRRADVYRIINYFDAHPLRSKKKRDYDTWRTAALLYFEHSGGSGGGTKRSPSWLPDAMNYYKEKLINERKYDPEDCCYDFDTSVIPRRIPELF